MALRVAVGPEEANQIEVQAGREMKLNTWSDEKLLLGFTAIEVRALLHKFRFNSDADLVVENRIAEATGDLEFRHAVRILAAGSPANVSRSGSGRGRGEGSFVGWGPSGNAVCEKHALN